MTKQDMRKLLYVFAVLLVAMTACEKRQEQITLTQILADDHLIVQAVLAQDTVRLFENTDSLMFESKLTYRIS